jgi:hypothetical protein
MWGGPARFGFTRHAKEDMPASGEMESGFSQGAAVSRPPDFEVGGSESAPP